MNHKLVAAKIATSWVVGGRITAKRVTDLTDRIEAALKVATQAENEACADLAKGCALPALAEAIRKRVANG